LNSKFALWSFALAAAFILFALNAFWKKKSSGSTDAAGFVLWQAVDGWINYVLYPAVIVWVGGVKAFAIMFMVTLVSNVIYIMVNNATESDWTFRSKLASMPVVKNLFAWKCAMFLFLSIKFDSFSAINFLFGKQADLRKAKVWLLFLASHAVCNGAWTLLLGGAITLLKSLLQA